MKTFKIFMLSLLVTTFAMAQDLKTSDLPMAVSDAFAQGNANATDVEWKKDSDNYKVEFDMGRMEHEIWYSASGEVVKKEQDIAASELPQAIKDAIKSKYPDHRIDDVEMKWANNETTYEVELEKGKEDWKLVFDPNGMIVHERRD